MAGTTADAIAEINEAIKKWQQGDFFLAENLFFIHLADLERPLTNESAEIANERARDGNALEVEGIASEVIGYIVVTQTCDIVRDSKARSYVELSPLVEVNESILKETRLLRRPAFAYIPNASGHNLIADLDRIITVEKSILSSYNPITGCNDDSERRAFAEALARHRNRSAFPDDFNVCMGPVRDYLKKIHRKNNDEGLLINSIGEIRVTASPNWNAERISIFLWFILHPQAASPTTDISQYIDKWLSLFGQSEKYDLQAVVCRLEDMKASDYVGSDRLDLDQLSAS
ncbi:MAG: hypothetical protein ACXW0T_08775 [Methylobacter sp.]|jgi:hypothetical protein